MAWPTLGTRETGVGTGAPKLQGTGVKWHELQAKLNMYDFCKGTNQPTNIIHPNSIVAVGF